MELFNNTRYKQSNFIIAILAAISVPVLGFIFSLLSIQRGESNKLWYCLLSLIIFFIFIYIPPVSDLYRHYQAFYDISSSDSFLDIIAGRLDLTLPLTMWLFKNLDLPFYLIPALYTSTCAYLVLKLTGRVINKTNRYISHNAFIALHFIAILLMPLFIIALGLRFGLACFISIYASVSYNIGDKNFKSFLILSIIATATHFFTFFVFCIVIASKIIFLKKLPAFLLSLICFIFASAILPVILSQITFMNLNVYTQAYLSGVFGSFENKNTNGLINYALQYTPFIIFLLHYITHKQAFNKSLSYLCNISLIALAILSIAPVASGRFVIIATYLQFFYFIIGYQKPLYLRSIFMFFLITYFSLFFIFENIFIQRRPIQLGDMQNTLYTPQIINIININDRFNKYFNFINPTNGEWIKDETDGS